jgi:hypothetical protein
LTLSDKVFCNCFSVVFQYFQPYDTQANLNV